MKGASSQVPEGTVELKAFMAGNDVLLFSENVPNAIAAIKKAVQAGQISEARIDESVRRILKAKAFAGLQYRKPVKVANITNDLNTAEATLIKRSITEHSITLAQAQDNLIPIKRADTLTIAAVSIGSGNQTTLEQYCAKYGKVDAVQINKDTDAATFSKTVEN